MLTTKRNQDESSNKKQASKLIKIKQIIIILCLLTKLFDHHLTLIRLISIYLSIFFAKASMHQYSLQFQTQLVKLILFNMFIYAHANFGQYKLYTEIYLLCLFSLN